MIREVILVFDNATWLDANRNTFYKTLNNYYQVICISTQSFISSSLTPEIIDINFLDEIKKLNLKNTKIVMGLSINGVGVTRRISDFFDSGDIPFHIWYWDYPETVDNEYTYKDNFFIYHVSQDYSHFFHKNKINSSWLPFATSPYVKNDQLPKKNIIFIGALWHINQIAMNLAAGLKKNGSEKIYHTHELLKNIHSKDFFDNKWTTRSGKVLVNNHVLSALSSIKRAQYLSCIQYHDLDIYGDVDWQFNLWDVAPELYSSCKNETIYNENVMKKLMQNYKLTINLFHLQNQNGGPNMRILDCANFGLPIFSDWNTYCEKIFPHNEAAYYFKSKKECIMYSEELIYNDVLRKKLVENAGEILNSGHTHNHRIKTFLSKSGLNENHENNEEVEFKNFDTKINYDKNIIGKKDIMKTQQGENQIFWSNYIDTVDFSYEKILIFINSSTNLNKLLSILKVLFFRVIKLKFRKKIK